MALLAPRKPSTFVARSLGLVGFGLVALGLVGLGGCDKAERWGSPWAASSAPGATSAVEPGAKPPSAPGAQPAAAHH